MLHMFSHTQAGLLPTITATYPMLKGYMDNTRPIREAKRICKDVDFISLAKDMDCQNRDVPAKRKLENSLCRL